MAVTMAGADQVLKIVYRELLANQLNTETEAFYNAIESSTEGVTGKEVRVAAPFGVNGGIGAGTETGNLPKSNGNQYKQFVSTLKNLYGTITISDKSMKATKDNEGAFLSLLQGEIEGLKKTAKFNLSRMLYGDGSGVLTTAKVASATTTIGINDYKYLIEGLTIDILDGSTFAPIANGSARRIINVNRSATPSITLDSEGGNVTTAGTEIITVQQSYNSEIIGLGEIFKNTGSLYGVDRAANYWMIPYLKDSVGAISDVKIQEAIDYLDEVAGSKVNFMICSSDVKRAYQAYMEATKRNVNTLDLKGGFSALSYNNIPLTSSKFAQSGTLKLLNTDDFKLYHMGDWDFLQGTMGSILNQIPGTPVWTASLVRYAELLCSHSGGQAELRGITA